MKRYDRDKLLEILGTVSEAFQYLLGCQNEEEFLNVLGQCAQALLSVEEHLRKQCEQREYEALAEQIVALLQALNDYQDAARPHSPRKAEDRTLKNQLHNLKAALNAIECPVNIWFLPYKVSMWDAMESVYNAAIMDSRCIVSVLAVPYYERNASADGHTLVCERAQFPPELLVKDFNTVSLAKERPDVIYIHNPYDGNNTVTALEPRFHSHVLKAVCSCLIYLPYSVSLPRLNNPMYLLPSYQNMSYIIAQSAEDRRCYIGNLGDGFKKRVLALGTGKLDRVLASEQSPPPLPAAWQQLKKGKKTIFLNTSLGSLLIGKENYLKRLSRVLDTLYDYRESVATIWRPHPLSDTTYASLQPALLADYLKIIENYKARDFGVYDQLPEYNTAFAHSDAYVGDSSSLLHLYLTTGKPVFLQDARLHIPGVLIEEEYPIADCGVLVGSQIYFPAANTNGLYRFDTHSGETIFLGVFPGEALERPQLYRAILHRGDRIYCFPYTGQGIGVYTISTGTFSSLPCAYESLLRFSCGVAVGETFYLLPADGKTLWVFDEKSESLILKGRLRGDLPHCNSGHYNVVAFKSGVAISGALWFSSSEEESLFCLEPERCRVKRVPLQHKGVPVKVSELVLFAGAIWVLSDRAQLVLRVLPKTGAVTVFPAFSGVGPPVVCKEYYFCHIAASEERLYFIDHYRKQLLSINETGSDAKLSAFPEEFYYLDPCRSQHTRRFSCNFPLREEVYTLSGYGRVAICLSEDGVKLWPLHSPQGAKKRCTCTCLAELSDGLMPSQYYRYLDHNLATLESFLNQLIQGTRPSTLAQQQKKAAVSIFANVGSAGVEIHRRIMADFFK